MRAEKSVSDQDASLPLGGPFACQDPDGYHPFDRLLLMALNERTARWTDASDRMPCVDICFHRVRYHGLALLLWDRRKFLGGWPQDLLDKIHAEARLQGLWEETHARLVASLIEQLASQGIPAAVNKGTALAYTVFSDPAMRQRGDTDMLFRVEDRNAIREVFQKKGFTRLRESETQEDWERDTGMGFKHVVDVHWRANSSPGVREIFPIEKALHGAVPLPRLSANAKAIEPVMLFLSDIINQAMHDEIGVTLDGQWVRGGERLIWTYGTHLQACGFSGDTWGRVCSKAVELGLQRLCLAALQNSIEKFGSSVPESALVHLRSAGADGTADRYLIDMSTAERALVEWKIASGWRQKFSRLSGHVAPPAEFMRNKYPGMRYYPILALYLRRLGAGLMSTAKMLASKI